MVVSAAVINYNGAPFLKGCLQSLLGQADLPGEIVVLDNRSTDHSVRLLREALPQIRLIELPTNIGYAAAANVAIRETRFPYLLLLNSDVVLTPTFVEALVGFAEAHPEAGSLTGKLLRFPREGGEPLIDSTGHLVFRSRWVVNRGEGEADRGQYDTPDEVFGVSGAAAFYRREMLEDVRVNGEVFAESFFLYLEDVDLDWRARLRGWKAYYVPAAVGYHERGYRSGARPRNSEILRHSLKNRYLMMARNDVLRDLLHDAWAILPMEVLRFLDFLVTSPRSLVGYLDAVRLLPAVLRQRRLIRAQVRVPRHQIRNWMRSDPPRREMRERARLLVTRS